MTKIQTKFSRYKIVDWLTLAIGVLICGIQIYRYTHNLLGDALVESIVLGVWILLMIAPKSLNDIIRKKNNL